MTTEQDDGEDEHEGHKYVAGCGRSTSEAMSISLSLLCVMVRNRSCPAVSHCHHVTNATYT